MQPSDRVVAKTVLTLIGSMGALINVISGDNRLGAEMISQVEQMVVKDPEVLEAIRVLMREITAEKQAEFAGLAVPNVKPSDLPLPEFTSGDPEGIHSPPRPSFNSDNWD